MYISILFYIAETSEDSNEGEDGQTTTASPEEDFNQEQSNEVDVSTETTTETITDSGMPVKT